MAIVNLSPPPSPGPLPQLFWQKLAYKDETIVCTRVLGLEMMDNFGEIFLIRRGSIQEDV